MSTTADPYRQGLDYQRAGDLRQAEESFRAALRVDRKDARAWQALGRLCEGQQRWAEAAACYQQTIDLRPGDSQAYFHLGSTMLAQGKCTEAEAAFRRCLERHADHVEALVNLGCALGEQQRHDDARGCYERAAQIRPDQPEIHHNLGSALRELGRLEEAVSAYRRALALRPDYAKAHVNLGIALVGLGALDEAVKVLRRGVELRPDMAEAHASLGAALSARGELDEALAEFDRALALNPDYVEPRWNQALLWLLRGDFARGWPAYEVRWKCKHRPPLPAVPQAHWDGTPLEGRTILLHAEQGLGDTLQFIRYAPLVGARGGRVVVQCQAPLVRLLSRCRGIDQLVGRGEPLPDFDVHAPLLSLPRLLGTTSETIPADVPYLHADPELVADWRQALAPVRGFRVGIAWQGSVRNAWDRHRSVGLADFEPLARIDSVHLISLQKGPGSEQVRDLGGRFPVVSLSEQIDSTAGAFMDTAAIIRNLDLVISVDTSVAHLAGGLGAPAWIALPYTPDWRWQLGRDDSPWYPSVRLFRQSAPGDWDAVFTRMAEGLRALASRAARPRPLLVEVGPGELLDKLTILQIKAERFTNPAALAHVRTELETLESVRREALPSSPELETLTAELRAVNELLWQVEEDLRRCERESDFGPPFVELARSVYRHNDHRAALKRAINDLLHARLVEEKSYSASTASRGP